MAQKGKPSKRVAVEASKIWRSETRSKIAKVWLDLLLTQASDHLKSAPKRTAGKRRSR
jgi:hypothetical protein